jgi:hypothetical protein
MKELSAKVYLSTFQLTPEVKIIFLNFCRQLVELVSIPQSEQQHPGAESQTRALCGVNK